MAIWESLQANFVSKKRTFSIVKGRRTPFNKSGGTFRSSLLPADDKSRWRLTLLNIHTVVSTSGFVPISTV